MTKTPLEDALPQDRILANEPMSLHTTFKVGGPADVFVLPASADEVRATIEAAKDAGLPWRVMGC